jgi:phage terminase small subunit
VTALTSRQEKFVEHFTLCGNAAEAARLAGYSAKTARVIGPENLSKPAVKQALEARQAVFRVELSVTKEDVVNGLLSAIQMGREQQNPAVMIQGCVQLAKLLGFYEPEAVKVDISSDVGRLQAKFAAMSDQELLAIVAGQGG